MNNNIYPVPENSFGIFAAHSREPIDQEFLKKIIDGPITLAQNKLNEHLKRIEDLRDYENFTTRTI